MTAKKAQAKRGGKQVVKRSASSDDAVGVSSVKKPRGKAKILKAPRGTVVIGSTSKPSALALLGLKVFSEGVQDALKEFAERNIPAVVFKNGRRIKAVPTKVGGRYVVVDSQTTDSDRPSTKARKRGVHVG